MLISHVIPAYNASKSIERTLNSVFDDPLPDGWSVEAIVVDDGSNDSDELAKIVEKYHNAKLVVHKTNRGMCAGRNTGITESKGDIVTILDSDDELVENWALVLKQVFENWPDETNVCYAACRNDRGAVTAQEPNYSGYLTLDDILNERYSGEYLPIFRGNYIREKPYIDLGTRKSCGAISYLSFASDGPFWISSQVIRIYHDSTEGSVTSGWPTPKKARETVQCYDMLFEQFGKLYKERAPKVYLTKHLRLAVYKKMAGCSGAWSSWSRGVGFSTLFESAATVIVLIAGRKLGSKVVLFSKKIRLIRQYG